MGQEFEYDVFLSHAGEDRQLARRLYEGLSRLGLRVFFSPETLAGHVGQFYSDVLADGIERSRHFMVLLSEQSHAKGWVKLEFNTFLDVAANSPADRLVLPVLTGQLDVAAVPPFLRARQAYRLDDKRSLAGLVSALAQGSGPAGQTPATASRASGPSTTTTPHTSPPPAAFTTCPACGYSPLPETGRFCSGCGKEVPGRAGAHLRASAGTIIAGRYELAEELSRGPDSTTYRARDLASSDGLPEVVLKLFEPGAEDDSAQLAAVLDRGELIRQRIASLPAAVRLLGWGKERANHYVVSELVPGQNLLTFRAERWVTVDQARVLAVELARALSAAHHAGLVHGCLTFTHTLVEPARHVRLLRLGYFKLGERVSSGTCFYEPAGFDPASARATDDIYAFGVLFWRLLTGTLPFTNEGNPRLLDSQKRRKLPPLAIEGVPIPAALAEVARRAAAPDPAERYESFAEVAADLSKAEAPDELLKLRL